MKEIDNKREVEALAQVKTSIDDECRKERSKNTELRAQVQELSAKESV